MATTAQQASQTLREKQKPLKDSYRSDPSAALVTLSSTSSLDPTSSSLTCSLNPSTSKAAKRVAGLHRNAGGEGFEMSGELCSGDMLLESLVACFGVTIRAVATAMGIEVKGGTVVAEGELDFRGTMGVKDQNGEAVRVGFGKVRLTTRLEVGEEDRGSVQKVLGLAERYCVVLQTLRAGVEVEMKEGHVGQTLPDTSKDSAVGETTDVAAEETEQGVENAEVLQLN